MRNFVPSNIDENEAKRKAKWLVIKFDMSLVAIGILFVSAFACSFLLAVLGFKNDDDIVVVWSILTIATTIIGTVGVWRLFGNGWYLKELRKLKESATCPSCQKSYCIEHTKRQTISESVISETSSNSKGETTTKHYRVGVRRIFWRCKECGETGEGEEEYREQV